MNPVITSYAPGRAELLGNHTDYNEGYVLAIAVARGTTIAGARRDDDLVQIHSRDLDKTESISLAELEADRVAPWSRYALGVVDQFRKRNLPLGGFEAEISSDLPIGAGLSSSASLENATALLIARLFKVELEPLTFALISQQAEHEFVGVRCGLLDQIASLFGKENHATAIDCRTNTVEHVPLSDRASIVIANSGVKHALVGGEYNQLRADCEAAAQALGIRALRDTTSAELTARRDILPERIFRRALHITGENERVLEGSAALRRGDVARFGEIMFQSHESSRVNFENSCPELDRLVEVARQTPGIYGARLSGGGFGGATINLVEKGHEEEVVRALTEALPGTTCLVSPAADGALEYARKQQP